MLHDIGIENGSSLKIILMDVKPTLVIDSKFNHKKIYIEENLDVFHCKVAQLRTIVADKTGLPIGVFRLVNKSGEEMFDCQNLRKYNVTLGQTVQLDVWDGWNDFLKVSINGYAPQVLPSLSPNETEAKYQLKVALHIAAFFGHVYLAVTLLKIGVRMDERVGHHPKRMWCIHQEAHIDSLSTPIHTAAARGNLNVIRSFVHHDITCVLATDGNNLTPLQIALKAKQKACALFLITQQWKEIPYDHKTNIPLLIYARMKSWYNRAHYKAPPPANPAKGHHRTSRSMRPIQSLVENGILVDGFSDSKMNSKSVSQVSLSQPETNRAKWQYHEKEFDKSEPENYFKLITSIPSFKFPIVGSSKNRKKRKSTHFLEESRKGTVSEPHFDYARFSNSAVQTYHGYRRNTEGLLKLPSIQLSTNEKPHLNRQISRSAGDLQHFTVNSKADVTVSSSAVPRKSMPHLKLYNTIDDEFQFVKKVSRSKSLFEDFLRCVK